MILPNAAPDKSACRALSQIYRQTVFGCFHHGRRSSCIRKKAGLDLRLIANHPAFSIWGLVFSWPLAFRIATSYPRRGRPPTTLGAKKLNFCVRHGNRCILLAIATTLFFWIITLQPLKCRLQESNLWPSVYDTDALPTELSRHTDPYGIWTHVTAVKGRCLNHLTNGPLLNNK